MNEKILFREPLTGQEFIATREELVSSFIELSSMLKDPEECGFVTINNLIDILNKKANCNLKKVENEFDFVWYRPLINNDLIDVETVHVLSLDETRACERLHYISKPVSYTFSSIDTFGWIHDTENQGSQKMINFENDCEHEECILLDFNVDV